MTIVIATSIAACGGVAASNLDRDDTRDLLGGNAQGDFDQLLQAADQHWAHRDEEPRLRQAIDVLKQLIKTSSPHLEEADRREALYGVYVKLSRAHFMLADDHIPLSVEDPSEVQEEIIEQLETSRSYAELAMAVRSSALRQAIDQGEDLLPTMLTLKEDHTGALFWWLQGLGRWMSYQSPLTAMNYVDRLEQMVKHLNALDPTYFYHGPVRFLAGYHTKVPWPGGDPARALALFNKARAADPDCLLNTLAVAEIYATSIGDRALYQRELEGLLNAPVEPSDPRLSPENRLARRKARYLLGRIDDTF